MPAPAAFGRSSLVGMLLVYAALALGVCGLSRAQSCRGPAPAQTRERVPTPLRALLAPVSEGMSFGTWTLGHITAPLRRVLPASLDRLTPPADAR